MLHALLLDADINECTTGTDQCQQVCRNTIGSYMCDCNSGFVIDANGRTCDGKCNVLNIEPSHVRHGTVTLV